MSQRRTVILCRNAPTHPGARSKLWAFSRADLAALLDCSEATIRRITNPEMDDRLDPADLEAICRAWAEKHWRELAIDGLQRTTV